MTHHLDGHTYRTVAERLAAGHTLHTFEIERSQAAQRLFAARDASAVPSVGPMTVAEADGGVPPVAIAADSSKSGGGNSASRGGDGYGGGGADGAEHGLEVVLRNVDTGLSELEIAAAGGFRSVARMIRSAGRGTRRPMPLVRATCVSQEQVDRLLSDGIALGAAHCVAQMPLAPAGGAAARGKRELADVASTLSLPAVTLARLVPDPKVAAAVLPQQSDGSDRVPAAASPTVSANSAPAAASPAAASPAAASPAVIVCRETHAYHRCAVEHTLPSDCILEIGSDLGALCALAWPLCAGKLVGVDLAGACPRSLTCAHPQPHLRAASPLFHTQGLTRALLASPHTRPRLLRRLAISSSSSLTCCRLLLPIAASPSHAPIRSGVTSASDLSISRARASYPHIRFEKLDALQAGAADALRRLAGQAVAGETAPAGASAAVDTASKEEAARAASNAFSSSSNNSSGSSNGSSGKCFSKIFIDINGNRPLPAVAGVLQMVLGELAREGGLQLVVVKSRELHDAVAARRGGVTANSTVATVEPAVEPSVAFEHVLSSSRSATMSATPPCQPVNALEK